MAGPAAFLKALKPPRMTWLHALYVLACILISLMAAAVYVWRDDIFERLVDPGIPYLLFKPPPAPNYRLAVDWVLLPAHPQTDRPRTRRPTSSSSIRPPLTPASGTGPSTTRARPASSTG